MENVELYYEVVTEALGLEIPAELRPDVVQALTILFAHGDKLMDIEFDAEEGFAPVFVP